MNLLFLHTETGTEAVAFKNRQTMFGKIWSLLKTLAKLPGAQGQARFIALGDLNTMGCKDGPNAKTEITEFTAAAQNGMPLLPKSHKKPGATPAAPRTTSTTSSRAGSCNSPRSAACPGR